MAGIYGLMLCNNSLSVSDIKLCDGRQTTNRGLLYTFYTANVFFVNCISHDPFRKGSPAYKSVKTARVAHKRVRDKVAKTLPGNVWLSQLGDN